MSDTVFKMKTRFSGMDLQRWMDKYGKNAAYVSAATGFSQRTIERFLDNENVNAGTRLSLEKLASGEPPLVERGPPPPRAA